MGMKIPYYHVDAFTTEVFSGNPAGVCLLEKWLPDEILQKIAAENRHSDTAFTVAQKDFFELRWFTPKLEVDLCGHATLAAAFVIFEFLGYTQPSIRFRSQSGFLEVERGTDFLYLNFPARPPQSCPASELLVRGLGLEPIEVLQSRDLLAVYRTQKDILKIVPDFQILSQLDCMGIIITAPGEKVDFVSRFFAPNVGVPEDPVTGSAHCSLIPYWAEKFDKNLMTALQLSERGGKIFCEYLGDRVKIGGKAALYMKGEIEI
jgi:PhzF family phenazine biosynthesis protein